MENRINALERSFNMKIGVLEKKISILEKSVPSLDHFINLSERIDNVFIIVFNLL